MKTFLPIVLVLIIPIQLLFAQDIQFSQFYRVQTYISPAFAGSAHAGRVMFHQRVQWPKLQAKYLSSYISYDTFLSKYNSGLGFNLLYDVQGGNTIRKMAFNLQYSYELTLSSKLAMRFGLQAGVGSNTLDYSNLYFPRQFNDDGLHTPDNGMGNESVYYPDLSSGLLMYAENWWVGYSAHHLNQPEISFIDSDAEMPMKHTIIAGYRFDLNSTTFRSSSPSTIVHLFPVVNLKFQGESDQVDVGLYGRYDHLLVGAWYRGIPMKKYQADLHNNESIVALVGWNYKRLSFTYSYDFVISKLTQVKHGGAHELNITFQNKKFPPKKRTQRRIPCPKFL